MRRKKSKEKKGGWEGRQIRRHGVHLHVSWHPAVFGFSPRRTSTRCVLGISAPAGQASTENMLRHHKEWDEGLWTSVWRVPRSTQWTLLMFQHLDCQWKLHLSLLSYAWKHTLEVGRGNPLWCHRGHYYDPDISSWWVTTHTVGHIFTQPSETTLCGRSQFQQRAKTNPFCSIQ